MTDKSQNPQETSKKSKRPIPSKEFLERVEKFKLKKIVDDFVLFTAKAYFQDITPTEGWIYGWICKRGYTKWCDEAINNIATRCGTCARTVNRAIEKLIALNMIWIESGKKGRTSNCIILIDPQFWKKSLQDTVPLCHENNSENQETTTLSQADCDTESSRLRHSVAQRVPEKRTIEEYPMCEEENSKPHTKEKILKDKKIQKTSKPIHKTNTKDIPMNMNMTLCEALKKVFNIRYIDNFECQIIIEHVLKETNCSLLDITKATHDFPQYGDTLIFSGIKRIHNFKNKPDIPKVSKELAHWMIHRDTIISESQKQPEFEPKPVPENEDKQEPQKPHTEENSPIPEPIFNNNENFLEEEKLIQSEDIVSKSEIEDNIMEENDKKDKLPKSFMKWYKSLDDVEKCEYRGELNRHKLQGRMGVYISDILPKLTAYNHYLENEISNIENAS